MLIKPTYTFTITRAIEPDISVAADDISVFGSLTNGDKTQNFGMKTNLSELKSGYEWSTTVHDGNTSTTNYTNVSLNGMAIIYAFAFVTTFVMTGQPAPIPIYAN